MLITGCFLGLYLNKMQTMTGNMFSSELLILLWWHKWEDNSQQLHAVLKTAYNARSADLNSKSIP